MSENLPAGWSNNLLKDFLDEDSLFCDGDWVESKDQDEEGQNRLIQLADVGDGKFLDKSSRFMNDAQFARLRCTKLERNDILIARMPEPLGRACLFPELNQRCATVVDVAILRRPRPTIDRSWLFYSINSEYVRRQIEIKSAGTTRTRITRSLLEKLVFVTPTQPEQKKIAEILKTLDKAIENTEALIEKYSQIKAGMMQDLFARGLTPDGKLRPSHAEAPDLYQETPIGWIPKEWKLTTCDAVCEKIIDCKNRTPPITPDGHPVIRTPNVRNGEFVDAGLVHTDGASYAIWTERGKPLVDDIVITREAPVGEVCKIPERHPEACLGQRMMLYRPDPGEIDSDFFLYALQSKAIQNRLDVISGGSTVGHVRVGDIRGLWIFQPSRMDEQKAIARSITAISGKVRKETEVWLKLQKQKSGLMNDLLTGKAHVEVDDLELENV